MSQPSNDAMFQIVEDNEQICSNILLKTMDSSGNQRAKQMHSHVNSFSSKSTFEPKPPLRPLSGYNIFFQLQRERIINHDESSTVKFTDQDVIAVIRERYNNWAGIVSHHDNQKYNGIKTKKVITFGELASKIAATWKQTDSDTKAIMNLHAEKERMKYFKIKREAEASLNRPIDLNSDQICHSPSQTSSDKNILRVQNTVAAFSSVSFNHKDSLGVNIPHSNTISGTLSKNDNMLKCYEDDWNCDILATNQQPNMVEMEQFFQCSKKTSNGFGVNEPKLSLLQDTHPMADFGIESYCRKKMWLEYLQQNLAYTKAQLKYNQHLRTTNDVPATTRYES